MDKLGQALVTADDKYATRLQRAGQSLCDIALQRFVIVGVDEVPAQD